MEALVGSGRGVVVPLLQELMPHPSITSGGGALGRGNSLRFTITGQVSIPSCSFCLFVICEVADAVVWWDRTSTQ
jgi:hypothetical protein